MELSAKQAFTQNLMNRLISGKSCSSNPGKGLLSKLVENMYSSYHKGLGKTDKRFVSPLFHVSSAIREDFCVIRQALAKMYSVEPKPERNDLGMYYIWEIGKTLESFNQNLTISQMGRHNVAGTFSCLCGEHSYSGVMLPEDLTPICSKCNTPIDRYSELLLRIGALNGSPDMLVNYSGVGFTVTEFKSINATAFKELTGPDPHHETQALSYVAMLAHLADTDPIFMNRLGIDKSDLELDKAVIVYTAKDYLGYANPVKCYETSLSSIPVLKKNTIYSMISNLGKYEQSFDAINEPGVCYSGPSINETFMAKCPLADVCRKHKQECNNPLTC